VVYHANHVKHFSDDQYKKIDGKSINVRINQNAK
jgi:hypothetical protein